jgi:alkanesulfonate monooxygenase SsuD/methylene tetrahydromethanopterin reductase-like flavin-dependent oxidoreductase (luciferase family)
MPSSRPFRFGAGAFGADCADDWGDRARRNEAQGYDTLLMPDHFGNQFAPVPALMAAALATTSLRIGSTVFDNDFRHPVMLAKEMATIDVLSGGRLEMGIGAGWSGGRSMGYQREDSWSANPQYAWRLGTQSYSCIRQRTTRRDTR